MQEKLEQRLEELEQEYAKGQQMQEQLAVLKAGEADLASRMARISGAIQVIKEILEVQDGA